MTLLVHTSYTYYYTEVCMWFYVWTSQPNNPGGVVFCMNSHKTQSNSIVWIGGHSKLSKKQHDISSKMEWLIECRKVFFDHRNGKTEKFQLNLKCHRRSLEKNYFATNSWSWKYIDMWSNLVINRWDT